jgi:predicted esterase
VDRAKNVLSTVAVGLRPGTARWRAVGVVGRLEGARSWRTGDLPIQDLAYLRGEGPPDQVLLSVPASLPPAALQPFQDHWQAAALVGAWPSAKAVAEVRFGTRLTQGPKVRNGYNAFLYHSRVPVPEGVRPDPRVFNGVYQPYGVWVPDDLPARKAPMVMFLHGADQYHTVNVAYFSNPASVGIPSPYRVPAVVIFPNGRTANWGTPLADRDALDAMEDAIRRIHVDRRRVVVSGVSSGGYGTYHLASRYPDLFTGAYSLVGGTGLGGGNVASVENLTNVPFRASNGLADPLVNVRTWRASADALKAAGTVDYRIVLVHNRSHDGPLAEGNCYLLDLLTRKSVTRPGRVRFRAPAYQKAYLDLGLQPRGAYWVDGITPRVTSRSAYVDATTGARRQRQVAESAISEIDENVTRGADFCGSNPAMQNGNSWQIEGRSYRLAPAPRRNRLTMTLENVARLVVDARRAGLDPTGRVRLRITSDGPASLRFEHDDAVLRIKPGTHTYRL